ncbi:MAG: hypothetical protein HYU36_17825 [Planctomycetes bacterium]|nr:hypothetical protein [Planctomycetota bacterium]
MSQSMPDPREAARVEAERIRTNRDQFVYHPLERVMKDAPWVDRESLVAGLEAFHRERMARVPSPARFPEAKPWVEHVRAHEHELRRLAELNDREVALYRSLHHYLAFRGFAQARPVLATAEKCRVAYVPETDQGALHIKNVDDPPTFWKRDKPLPPRVAEYWWDKQEWAMDGVGSGLHIDDEPEEIFPLPVLTMVGHYANDVPSVVDFLRRYSPFWGGSNNLVYDKKRRSVAIEKCSFNGIEVYEPGPDGQSHISGMACRDPKSSLGRYQTAKRDRYRALFKLPEDGPDSCFWKACDRAEQKLSSTLKRLGRRPRVEEVTRLFVTPWPDGLCKCGSKFHPNQGYLEYTLITIAHLLDRRRSLRWQRNDDDLGWPSEPEVSQA